MASRKVPQSHVIDKSDVTYGEPIGKGAFGTVFKVTLKTLEGPKEAAAKKVASSTQSEEELKFMSSLSHKNIISFYGFIREKSHLTIITELAEKGDLQSFLHSTSDPLPKELIKKWTREAAEGIRYLHQQKTVHKDVKSSNYLITSDDVLKLGDFGTVGDLDHTGKTEHRKGTVRWMAPEVIKQEVRSSKSDVFAYGIVTWEICVRQVPFAKLQTRSDIMDAIVEGRRPKIPHDCPVVLRKIMQSCWKEDHRERPSMYEIMLMLESNEDVIKNDDDDDSDEESEDDEELEDVVKFFEKASDEMQNFLREKHEHQPKNERAFKLLVDANKTVTNHDKILAQGMKISVEQVKKKTTVEERKRHLIEQQTKLDADKERRKRFLARLKTQKQTSKSRETFGVDLHQKSLILKAKEIVTNMSKLCYKCEDWDETNLKSFTRMSTMYANIPDVIENQCYQRAEFKTYAEPQDTSSVFNLKSIPSKSLLLWCKGNICSKTKSGEYGYFETEIERFGLDTIEQMCVIHRVLEIKEQVKEEIVWAMVYPYFPRLVEKRVDTPNDFMDMVSNKKCDQVLEGYDMDPMMISKMFCDHALSHQHILWFLTLLNQTQSDVFCLYPQSEDDTQSRLCELLEDDREKPSFLILVFCVRRSRDEVVLANSLLQRLMSDSHFSLCYVNCLTNTVLYADSLGWPAPTELRETAIFYYQCIYGYCTPDLDVTFCHEPSSVYARGKHACCKYCATYYPLQTCRNISGVVVIIMASVACLDSNMFWFLTTCQPYKSHPVMSHFQKPTEFSKFLRVVLLSWMASKHIDLTYLRPHNFNKYLLFNSLDPSDLSGSDLAPFIPLINMTPGLIDLLLPESAGVPQEQVSYHRRRVHSPNVHTHRIRSPNFKMTSEQENKQQKTTIHWSGSGLELIDEDTIASCTRMDTTRLQLPGISEQLKHGHIVTYEEDKLATNVFQQSEIPDQQTLLLWKDDLEKALSSLSGDCKVYIEAANDTRYDHANVCKALQVQRMCETKLDVEEELKWFDGYQMKPLETTKVPSATSIKRFRKLIHDHKPDEILASYNMDAREMSSVCCSRRISEKQVRWIVDKLNSMQSKVACVFDVDGTTSSAAEIEDMKSTSSSVLMIFTVYQSDGAIHFGTGYEPGCHFTLCYVDDDSRMIIYGDSCGWAAPESLLDKMKSQYKKICDRSLPQMEFVMCHDTTFNTETGQHNCSPLCGTHYPLHSSNDVSGVVCSIMAAIACLAPDYFEFLCVPQYNTKSTGSCTFHMQYPTLHSNYLRRVLAAWFADDHIDIDHVVPQGFEIYKQLAVSGSLSASVVLRMGGEDVKDQ